MVFQCINIRQVPWEVLNTAAFGLGFQHLLRDLTNVNIWKTMFDPYSIEYVQEYPQSQIIAYHWHQEDEQTNENHDRQYTRLVPVSSD